LSTDRKLQTSDEISITTVNPGMLPLPDKWTLDMQFILQQVATLKGALTTMMTMMTNPIDTFLGGFTKDIDFNLIAVHQPPTPQGTEINFDQYVSSTASDEGM
jgi:hypothetical protein